jgi:glycosyltransferase EpsF
MKTKRVLQIPGSMNIGGAEVLLMNFLRSLPRDEAEAFDFLIFGEQPQHFEREILDLGANVIRMTQPRRTHPRSFARSLQQLMAETGPYEVVHSHVNLTSSIILSAAKKSGVLKRIAHAHIASDRGGIQQTLYRNLASSVIRRAATDLIACSPEAGTYLFGPSWSSKGILVPNAVSIEDFSGRTDSTKLALRKELGVASEDVLIGSVSRLVDFKNLGFLMPVVSRATTEGLPLHLAIVGDGPERTRLEALAEEWGVSSRVTFLGMRNDIPHILKGLDVLVAPSLYEGLPVSLIEAQAAGLPAVVSTGISSSVAVVDGLVQFAPIDDPSKWIKPISDAQKVQVSPQEVQHDLQSHGYTIDSLASTFRRLYGWDT